MPVSKETARRVLAASLIAGGLLLALACGVFAILVLSMAGLVGAGNPSPETVAAGVREGRIAIAVAMGVALIGVAAAVLGLEMWLRLGEKNSPCCQQCGYDLRGLAPATPCPECGLKQLRSDRG